MGNFLLHQQNCTYHLNNETEIPGPRINKTYIDKEKIDQHEDNILFQEQQKSQALFEKIKQLEE